MSQKNVRMLHDNPGMTGGPTSAEVPEDGVEMMRRAGWTIAPEQPEGGDPSQKDTGGSSDGARKGISAKRSEHVS